MTKIISMSLSEDLLAEIGHLEKSLGFSGRSEVIRAGVRMLLADARDKERLSGKISGVLLVIHSQGAEGAVTQLKHRFEDIIHTQIHSHMKGDKCLEIFTLEGPAARVVELQKKLTTGGRMDYVKLVVP